MSRKRQHMDEMFPNPWKERGDTGTRISLGYMAGRIRWFPTPADMD